MCLHCVALLSKDELLLWSLAEYSQSYLEFLFTTDRLLGRMCTPLLRPVLHREVPPVMDTSIEDTPSSRQSRL